MTSKKELEQERERSYTTMANWALILAILSWLVLGIVLAPTSIILGTKALKTKDGATKATAVIALIIGGIATAVLLFTFMVGYAAITAWR